MGIKFVQNENEPAVKFAQNENEPGVGGCRGSNWKRNNHAICDRLYFSY